ncbi:MAG: hypothetical protein P8123_03800 [bacterium]
MKYRIVCIMGYCALTVLITGCANIYPTKFSTEVPLLPDPAQVNTRALSIGVTGFERKEMLVVGESTSIGTASGSGSGMVSGTYGSANSNTSANVWGIGSTVEQREVETNRDLHDFKYALENTRLFNKVMFEGDVDYIVTGRLDKAELKINPISLLIIISYTWLLGVPLPEKQIETGFARIYDKDHHFIEGFNRKAETHYYASLYRFFATRGEVSHITHRNLINALASDVSNKISAISKNKAMGDSRATKGIE